LRIWDGRPVRLSFNHIVKAPALPETFTDTYIKKDLSKSSSPHSFTPVRP
jgi:hypothetical protein